MLMTRPDFLDSPYVVDDPSRPGLHFLVIDGAPADERRRLMREIRKWERTMRNLEAQRLRVIEEPPADDDSE